MLNISICKVMSESTVESEENRILDLKKYLQKNYGNYVQLKQQGDNIWTPYIVAFHRHIYHYVRLKETTDLLFAVAQQFPQLRFVISSDSSDDSASNSTAGDDDLSEPAARIYLYYNDEPTKYESTHDATKLAKFCNDFLEKSKFKSEPIPKPQKNDWFVKKAVALNFHELVIDNPKDVVLFLYMPWGYIPYQKVATRLKKVASFLFTSGDYKNIDIIRINAELNTVSSDFVNNYMWPVFTFYKRNDDMFITKPWRENLSVYSMLKFIGQNSTHLLKGYDRDGEIKNKKHKRKRKEERYDSKKYVDERNPYSIQEKYGINIEPATTSQSTTAKSVPTNCCFDEETQKPVNRKGRKHMNEKGRNFDFVYSYDLYLERYG